MTALKHLSKVICAIEEWEEDFEEEVSEDIEEALTSPGWERHKQPKTDKLDKLLLLLDPKFKDYLEDKLPVNGKVES